MSDNAQKQMTQEDMKRIAVEMAIKMLDEGNFCMGGWESFKMAFVPEETHPEIMRWLFIAFMSGSIHLFSGVNQAIINGEEANTIPRLNKINEELVAAAENMKSDMDFAVTAKREFAQMQQMGQPQGSA